MWFLLFILFSGISLQANYYSAHLSDVWYPNKSEDLHNLLSNLQHQALQHYKCAVPSRDVKALLVPHAAYAYSGVTAISAYRVIKPGDFKRVIILAPSHYVSFTGVALPSAEYDSYQSRMGMVSLDVNVLHDLSQDSSRLFLQKQQVHDGEHSVEMQIPFIQKYCGDCKIVPLIMGNLDMKQLQVVADRLKNYVDDSTLLVATSDLVHYGAQFRYTPFVTDIALSITKVDNAVVEALQNIDLSGFRAVIDETRATVCGIMPISCLLLLLQNQQNMHTYVTCYDRSAGLERNPAHSVSYVGMVFAKISKTDLPLKDYLTGYERTLLLRIVDDALHNLDHDSKWYMSGVLTKSLCEHLGVFVTLRTSDHRLRGCIGRTVSDQPLYQQVYAMAKEAALHDFRFKPVTSNEVPTLKFSLSVLTDPYSITSYNQIRLGIDGVIINKDNRGALFLPSVATEFGWDLATFLSQLCLKAKLPADAFKDPSMKFWVFQAVDISV